MKSLRAGNQSFNQDNFTVTRIILFTCGDLRQRIKAFKNPDIRMAFITNNTIQNMLSTYAEISKYNDMGYTDGNVMPGSSLLYRTP